MTVKKHISGEIFDRYEARKATSAETIFVQTHAAVCETCRAKLARISNTEKAFAAIRSSFSFDNFADAPEHLPYQQLEFFVDDKLDEVDREIAESHLAICGECAKDLADLQIYRQIAAAPTAEEKTVESEKQGFWKKLFAFDSIGSFAPVAAVLLIAVLLGAWFLLRGTRGGEIAQANNQNSSVSNVNPVSNSLVSNPSPDILPSPEVSPSPTEIAPNKETIYALNDGQLTVDDKGNINGLENLSPAAQNLIKQSLQTGKISVTANSLGGGGGVLMSDGGSADNGVPFALVTPIGKIIKENQPVLRWKPLKDAVNYSVAIVDDKFRIVEQSGKLTATSWKPTKNLPRGINYSWQVTATLTDGTETVSPSSPAPQARFRVIEQDLFSEINRLENSGRSSHLALGVLYAKAGLKQEARIEFEKLVRQNPNSKLARQLLQSVK